MAKKGGFTDDAAMMFISKPEEPQATPPAKPSMPVIKGAMDALPEGYKLSPMYIEKKTKRLQLVLQPSLYRAMKERAEDEGISLNEFIHRTMAAALKED